MLMTRHAHAGGLAVLLGAVSWACGLGCGGKTQAVAGGLDGDIGRDATARDGSSGSDAGDATRDGRAATKRDAGHDANCPTSCPPLDCDAGCTNATMTLCLPLSSQGNPDCRFGCYSDEVWQYVCYYGCAAGGQACNTGPVDGGPDAPYLHDAAVGSDCLTAHCGP